MFNQNFLNESDIDTLINLLLRSQQSRTREALCVSIGIDPKRLSFLRDSSDSDFFLLLIRYLNEIGDQEALCKLCCKELGSIFQKGTYGLFLNELAEKLNCNLESKQSYLNNQQQTVPLSISAPSVRVNPFNQLIKNKLITGGTILLIGLTGFSLFNQNKNSNSSSTHQSTLEATNSKGIAIQGKQGQTVKIEVSGKVHTHPKGIEKDCDKWTGPNGITECQYVENNETPYRKPFMALIGQFKNDPPFVVGEMYEYKFKNTGTLQLNINDYDHTDNKGYFTIETTITN
jgi:hypothetical protein